MDEKLRKGADSDVGEYKMELMNLFKGRKKPTTEKTTKERSQLELQLESIARPDNHNVKVSVVEGENVCQVAYVRCTDQALIDKVTALPMEVRERQGWVGKDYLKTLSEYTHSIDLEIVRVADTYGGLTCPREDGFFMKLSCRSPIGLGNLGAMQLQVNLGQFSENDRLSAPKLECLSGNLTMKLFYRGDHQQLDGQFAQRVYEAFETVYDTVSVPAELSRKIDATKQKPSPAKG